MPDGTEHGQGSWFKVADSKNRGRKNDGGSWFNIANNTESGVGQNPDGRKASGDWFGSYADMKAAGTISPGRLHGKGSKKRAEASAQIAKIPFELARHIASVFGPQREEQHGPTPSAAAKL